MAVKGTCRYRSNSQHTLPYRRTRPLCFPFRSSAVSPQSPPELKHPNVSHTHPRHHDAMRLVIVRTVSSDSRNRIPGIWAYPGRRLGGCHACETGQSVPGIWMPDPTSLPDGYFAAVPSTARSGQPAFFGDGTGWTSRERELAGSTELWLVASTSSHKPPSPRPSSIHCLWSSETFRHVSLAGR